MRKISVYSIVFAVVALLAAHALAATRPKSVVLSSSELFERASGSKTVRCGYIGGHWIPGVLVSGGAFASRAAQIRAVKKDITLASSDVARQKLEAKRTKIQKAKKNEAPLCNEGPPATPTPTTTPTATPSPTATPGSQGCYDEARNTSCFGIPSGAIGNENDGETLFNSFCLTCHDGSPQPEPRDMTYGQINDSFSNVPDMNVYIGGFTVDELADLTAFLNRYNPNQ